MPGEAMPHLPVSGGPQPLYREAGAHGGAENGSGRETAKGKSIIFLAVVFLGYICGISAKIVGNEVTYVLFFYVLNFVMVAIDIALYFVNSHRDNLAQQACPHEI